LFEETSAIFYGKNTFELNSENMAFFFLSDPEERHKTISRLRVQVTLRVDMDFVLLRLPLFECLEKLHLTLKEFFRPSLKRLKRSTINRPKTLREIRIEVVKKESELEHVRDVLQKILEDGHC
jgi:hypothetical protein